MAAKKLTQKEAEAYLKEHGRPPSGWTFSPQGLRLSASKKAAPVDATEDSEKIDGEPTS
jgi:hypothetical protein